MPGRTKQPDAPQTGVADFIPDVALHKVIGSSAGHVCSCDGFHMTVLLAMVGLWGRLFTSGAAGLFTLAQRMTKFTMADDKAAYSALASGL
jgi:hypothetical protein